MKKVFLGMKMSYFVFRLKSHLFRCKGRDLERVSNLGEWCVQVSKQVKGFASEENGSKKGIKMKVQK